MKTTNYNKSTQDWLSLFVNILTTKYIVGNIHWDRKCSTIDVWPRKFGAIVTGFKNVRTSVKEDSEHCKPE